jgi:predicted nucleic acid-binding protein
MPDGDAFFDTNVLIYMIGSDEPKVLRSEELVAAGGTISVQVLNEFANVARRKQNMPWGNIHSYLDAIVAKCRVAPVTLEIHRRGLELAQRRNFAIYDAMIVAAAQLSGCRTLYSEDMHDGLTVDGLRVVNPYK